MRSEVGLPEVRSKVGRLKESRFKMGKRVAVILMAAIMILSFQAGACAKDGGVYGGEEKEVSVITDGERLNFSQDDGMGVPFIDSAGRVQAPVRKVLEKAGAEVSFETDAGSGEGILGISKDGTMIRLTAGSPLMRVNQDVVYQLDTSPQIIEGRTYMPLRAVLETLGYSVSWDGVSRTVTIEKNQDGPPAPSAISGSAVTPVGQFNLPRDKYADTERPEVIVNHGYLYYITKNNAVMQSAFSDLTKSRKVYDCPADSAVHLFNDENGEPRLYYHTAGASLGSPHQFVLNTDGSMTELNGGRDYAAEVYSTGGKTFAFTELKFGPDRPEMKNEEGKYVNLGGTENQYYYETELNGFNGRRGVYLIGDELYLTAAPLDRIAERAVYKVNIKTGEISRVTDVAYRIQIEGDYLYYSTGKEVRRKSLKDGTETSLYNFFGSATGCVTDFAVLNGNLYLADRNSFFLPAVNLGEEASFEEGNNIIFCYDMALRGAEAEKGALTSNGEQYLICQIGKTDKEKENGSLWMRVYDEDGRMVMEREGDIRMDSVSIEGDKICYYNNTTNQINVEKLR